MILQVLKEPDAVLKHRNNEPSWPRRSAVERRASIPEVVGSISTAVGQNFQPTQCGLHSE